MNLELLGCINCLVAVGMFSGMLYLMLNYRKSIVLKNFIDTLSPELVEVHQDVIYERMTIYLQGLVLGLVLGLIYLNYAKQTRVNRACTFTVIMLGTNYFYYILMPKSQYLVPLLETREQREAWIKVYREMQYRCKMGFVLGMVAYFLVGYFV